MASRELNMADEADRLSTFETWPSPHIQPRDLAACGFYYTRVADLVKCFTCGVEIGGWQRGDDPLVQHDNWRSDCPFIQNYLLENFPVPASLANYHHVPHSCPFHHKTHKTFAIKMKLIQKTLEMLKIYETGPPDDMKFATYESRLQTFKTWPMGLKIKPEKLCEAGFYYSGKNDTTVCFHCGKDLNDWLHTDDPWVEHALFSPKCSYVLLNKGIDFVEAIFKGKGTPKLKKYTNNMQIPDALKGMIEIRHHADPVASRSANKSAALGSSSIEKMGCSQPNGLKGAVGKKVTGSKGFLVKASKVKASKGSLAKGSKAKASKGSSCYNVSLDGSKKVDDKNDDTVTLKKYDTKERDGGISKIDGIAHDYLCKICFQETLGIAILPCGHLVACVKCAPSLNKCIVCFEDCVATVRIYLS